MLPIADLERVLVDLGAVKESDSRLKKRSNSFADDELRPGAKTTVDNDDDDDDWD